MSKKIIENQQGEEANIEQEDEVGNENRRICGKWEGVAVVNEHEWEV